MFNLNSSGEEVIIRLIDWGFMKAVRLKVSIPTIRIIEIYILSIYWIF